MGPLCVPGPKAGGGDADGAGMRQRRAFTRLKRRLSCDIRVHGCEYLGVVRDLSPGGFFIQTSVAPATCASQARSATSLVDSE